MTSVEAPRVDILLSTYNGSRHLHQLLRSISLQTYRNWRLIVRDDGSEDNTLSILKNHGDSWPNQIQLLDNDRKHLGPCGSFSKLMEYSTAKYVMFCDQDDVWIENKTELLLGAMRELEHRHGEEIPILVHSDLKVVDDNLETLSESFWNYQKMQPKTELNFNRQLMQNVVTGNASIINRIAAKMAAPIPEGAIMHDWWLALVVSAFGYIHHISNTTVLYRQHDNNDTGAKEWGIQYVLNEFLMSFATDKIKKSIALCQQQAGDFLRKYYDDLQPQKYEAAYILANIGKLGPIARRRAIWRHRLLKYGFVKNIGLFLMI